LGGTLKKLLWRGEKFFRLYATAKSGNKTEMFERARPEAKSIKTVIGWKGTF